MVGMKRGLYKQDCIVFLCFASFVRCEFCMFITRDINQHDLFICTWETLSGISENLADHHLLVTAILNAHHQRVSSDLEIGYAA